MRLHGTLNAAACRYRANGLPAISAGSTVALASTNAQRQAAWRARHRAEKLYSELKPSSRDARRERRAITFARPRGAHRLDAFSLTLQRRLTLYRRSALEAWLMIESDRPL